jgi:hypothetical protein
LADVLTAEQVQAAFDAEGVQAIDCVYTPLTTVHLLLSQALDPDPSLRQAVSRLLAERAAAGHRPISAATGAYSQARARWPEGVLRRLARDVGRRLLAHAPDAWRWKGRDVKIADGTTVSMPDTAANQAAWPQPSHQRPGLGLPLARLMVVFSLAVGTVLDAALGPCRGKQTGETALFRSLHACLCRGDVVLSDRYFCSYFEIALLMEMGVEVVRRLHQRRPVDFRRGRRLGRDDRLMVWTKPKRPEWMDEATYQRLPNTLRIRQVRLRVAQEGFRTQTLVVATTLLDRREASSKDLTDLYRMRWQAELDLRSLKETMCLGVLRGKTPAMVGKEIWSHLLAYNLMRTVLAQAAQEHPLLPRELSFQDAVQTLLAFAPHVALAERADLADLARQIRAALVQHRVGDRPDRYEPRARKRRYSNYQQLRIPRAEAKARLRRGTYK